MRFFSLLEKLEFVMDWLDVEEVVVAVELEMHPPLELQDRMARQWITGLTSRQNSG